MATTPFAYVADASDAKALAAVGSGRSVLKIDNTTLLRERLDQMMFQAVLQSILFITVQVADNRSFDACITVSACPSTSSVLYGLATIFRDPAAVLKRLCPAGVCPSTPAALRTILDGLSSELSTLGRQVIPSVRDAHFRGIANTLRGESMTLPSEQAYFQGLFPMLASIESQLQRTASQAAPLTTFTSPPFLLGRELPPWVGYMLLWLAWLAWLATGRWTQMPLLK